MSPNRFRFAVPATLLLLAAMSPALASSAAVRPERAAVRCEGAIQHPLEVHVTALDPLVRGGNVRVRVTTTARRDVARGEVQLTSAGGAAIASPTRARFGRLAAGRTATQEFAVRIPAEGHRFLLQFRVTGEGRNGTESRGATFNLLPDGPADPGRVVDDSHGGQVTEYASRRIDR